MLEHTGNSLSINISPESQDINFKYTQIISFFNQQQDGVKTTSKHRCRGIKLLSTTGTRLGRNTIGWHANRFVFFSQCKYFLSIHSLLHTASFIRFLGSNICLLLQAKSKCRACSKAIKAAAKWTAEGSGSIFLFPSPSPSCLGQMQVCPAPGASSPTMDRVDATRRSCKTRFCLVDHDSLLTIQCFHYFSIF